MSLTGVVGARRPGPPKVQYFSGLPAVWVPVANSALIWMAVLPGWFALRTAAGCWSRTKRAEHQQSHLWRPMSRCASFQAMPVAAANGIEINYTDSGGQGPAVVFSHGYLMDHTMFDQQVTALAPQYRVITWDQRGHGGTRATGAFTYWDSAADVLALLDQLGVERAVLAGMSQGGFLSLRAALTAPDRVRALVLIDSQAGLEDPANAAGYEQMHQAWLDHGPGPVQEVVASIILARGSGTAGTPRGTSSTRSGRRMIWGS
ncbi:MAG TPA: alpha/beta hydrolase [Streptosporangiaceae bacterium]|nr:alpha/beta hydrolase [Streptosporangiaceae bacterium]